MHSEISYGRRFARYTVLSILGTLGVSCYILADTFFVANGLGTHGLAALNIAIPVYNFIHGCGLMFGMGGATRFSIARNTDARTETSRIFSHTVLLGLLTGICFSLIGLLFPGSLAEFLGADAKTLQMTTIYLHWLLLFAPAFIMNDILLCFVRNDGEPGLAAAAMLAGSFSNILMDYIFIFPMKMGILGAVLATGFSPVISMSLISSHWIRKKNSFGLIRPRLSASLSGDTISLGFPSLIGQLATGISMIIFNLLILRLEGNVGVAAYGVIANIALVVVGIYTGISQGVQPLISDAYGRGDSRGIRLSFRYAVCTSLALSALMYLILSAGADPITSLFNKERDPHLQEISIIGLRIYFSAIGFAGFNTILATYFTSVERPLPAHILSLLRGLVLLVPAAFLLSYFRKMTGIWLTYPITEGISALPGIILLRSSASAADRSGLSSHHP